MEGDCAVDGKIMPLGSGHSEPALVGATAIGDCKIASLVVVGGLVGAVGPVIQKGVVALGFVVLFVGEFVGAAVLEKVAFGEGDFLGGGDREFANQVAGFEVDGGSGDGEVVVFAAVKGQTGGGGAGEHVAVLVVHFDLEIVVGIGGEVDVEVVTVADADRTVAECQGGDFSVVVLSVIIVVGKCVGAAVYFEVAVDVLVGDNLNLGD